jgi:hypothetical protein
MFHFVAAKVDAGRVRVLVRMSGVSNRQEEGLRA